MTIDREKFIQQLLTSLYNEDEITRKRRRRATIMESKIYWDSASYVIYKCSITSKCLELLLKRVDRLSAIVYTQIV